MEQQAYEYYTTLFGHTKLLNRFVNRFSNSSIRMGDSVSIGRNTQFIGNIDIGSHVKVDSNVQIYGDVEIGEYTNLNGNNSVRGEVSIGKYCAIAPRSRMRTSDHPTYKAGLQFKHYDDIGTGLSHVSEGPIEIGNDVWVCSDAKILSDVTIGNGAVIAADSVVVNDVEPYSIVAGNPATHKKYRFDQDTIDALQEIAWWDWSTEKQKRNIEFFDADLREVEDIRSLVE
jgi:virginiamycin A acetyltransferase